MGALSVAFALVVASLAPPQGVKVTAPEGDDGQHLHGEFSASPDKTVTGYRVYRTLAFAGLGETTPSPDVAGALWIEIKALESGTLAFDDEVPDEADRYRYAVRAVVGDDKVGLSMSPAALSDWASPHAAWFNRERSSVLGGVVLMLALLGLFYELAKRQGKAMYIRRISGVDALEEAIGRSTEMGRPVLYVPGIEEIQNMQTVASLLILGNIAEMVARYDTEIKVPCCIPLTMVVAEEIVRQGYFNAGRPDAHREQNIQFISSEQFAFTAGVNGIILREKPATNIYLGCFYAESLILAETGYVNKSIQIAGTAEITQLPFFIAACDYTLIGEELYAVSAYLSRDPRLMSTLKAADLMKLVVIGMIVVGTVLSTFGTFNLGTWLFP
jgi:hypothetical protein